MKVLYSLYTILFVTSFGTGFWFRNHDVKLKFSLSKSLSSTPSITESIFQRVKEGDSSFGAGGSSSFRSLQSLDKSWNALKEGAWKNPIPVIIQSKESERFAKSPNSDMQSEYDIAVIGGTLGVFYAYSLLLKGYRVAIFEKGQIKGRSQEWNISRKELSVLVDLKILTADEIEEIISIEFNPVRVGFHTDTSVQQKGIFGNGFEMKLSDILNLGIKPDKLIEKVKEKFIARGGQVFESCQVRNISVFQDMVTIEYQLPHDTSPVVSTTRLVIDAMGNSSPIVRQIRGNVEPDGVCIVVGSCARGFHSHNNTYSDVIYTNTPITTKSQPSSQLQYFWEAFPAGSGESDRTTYLFTYLDAKPERPSLLSIFEDYWELLPRYQGKSIEELEFLRILFGVFPTYRKSPIQSPFSRVIQVGDASGIQSPLSFGGFGSLTRHLKRVTEALDEALQLDLLHSKALNCINSYQPNLSAGWMFQRAMSVRLNHTPSSSAAITQTLSNSFEAMQSLGDATIRPFLQDVLQFAPLIRTLSLAFLKDPFIPVKVIPQVGVVAIVDFAKHLMLLGWFTALFILAEPFIRNLLSSSLLEKEQKYYLKRWYEQLQFGSGLDYEEGH